jgi:hypothetical protein
VFLTVWGASLFSSSIVFICCEFRKNLASSSSLFTASASRRFEFHKAVNFSFARATKRFPSSRCASAIQIFRPLESMAEMPTGCYGLLTTCGAGLLASSPPLDGLAAASCALTFWIWDACSSRRAVSCSTVAWKSFFCCGDERFSPAMDRIPELIEHAGIISA